MRILGEKLIVTVPGALVLPIIQRRAAPPDRVDADKAGQRLRNIPRDGRENYIKGQSREIRVPGDWINNLVKSGLAPGTAQHAAGAAGAAETGPKPGKPRSQFLPAGYIRLSCRARHWLGCQVGFPDSPRTRSLTATQSEIPMDVTSHGSSQVVLPSGTGPRRKALILSILTAQNMHPQFQSVNLQRPAPRGSQKSAQRHVYHVS